MDATADGNVRLRCACGWEVSGLLDEVVAATEEHGRRLHNMVPTRDEVLAMLVPLDAQAPASAANPPADR